MDIRKSPIPITQPDVDLLCAFWGEIFGHSYQDFAPVLGGEEQEWNDNTLYLAYKGDQLTGTCLLTRCRTMPEIAGLGEVAVPEAFRGRGIASTLCEQARDDFFRSGGRALWLATSNPVAFRVYHRLGWRRLANANVMANIAVGSPEEWLIDYFRKPTPITVSPGDPGARIPMIPLILTPHDDHVLDANLGLFSTRYVLQESCMGLYPRYAERPGAWFMARDAYGRVVGLSTAHPDNEAVSVDGFTHPRFADCWEKLMSTAIDWAKTTGLTTCRARVSSLDREKRERFSTLGFQPTGQHGHFPCSGEPVPTVCMEKTICP